MAAPFPSPTKNWHTETYDAISPTRPELSAKGKTVVVTGGGTGIGAETARYFAKAGATRIAILGRREKPLLDTKASIEKEFPGVEVLTAPADVTKRSDVESALAKFAGNGKINVMVSNAAMIGPQEPVQDVDSEGFLNAIQMNVRGSLNIAQTFARYAAPDAVVIDVNSSAAHVDFGGRFAAYSVAKMAVLRLWDALAGAYPEISLFHIQPGVVDTAMNKEAGGIEAIGHEDDVSLPASFNVWLASPEAKFLKNKFLWTNWDVDELQARAKELQSTGQLSIGLAGWPFADESWKVNWKS